MSAESTIRTWMDYGVEQKQRADAAEAALSEMRAELERWQNNWDANVQEMSEKFRAVNLAQVMAGTNMDLLARATAAEAQLERARMALKPFSNAAASAIKTGRRPHDFVIIEDFHAATRARALSQDEPADLGVGG